MTAGVTTGRQANASIVCRLSHTVNRSVCFDRQSWLTDGQVLSARDPPIKFLSFHNYLRKLNTGVDRYIFMTLNSSSWWLQGQIFGFAGDAVHHYSWMH